LISFLRESIEIFLFEGSYHVLLEVINSLAERSKIAFDGLRVGSELSEHLAHLLTQGASHLFGYEIINVVKHTFDRQ
jgi:ssRNA-specific RNase YbeY (16S rRNA maturation enzyme)